MSGSSAKRESQAQPALLEFTRNLWTFHYRKGAAFMSGIVAAPGQESAIRVAAEWCKQANVKKLTDPCPMILADESILVSKVPAEPVAEVTASSDAVIA